MTARATLRKNEINKMYKLRQIEPIFRGDARDFFINGFSKHQFILPVAECQICEGINATKVPFAFECPIEIREEIEVIRRQQGVVDEAKWQHYVSRWQQAVNSSGFDVQLKPGSRFTPLVWQIPSHPRADTFFANHLIVSERFRNIIDENEINGLRFLPVKIESVGDREPFDPLPAQGYEESIDLLKMIPHIDDPNTVGRFHEVLFNFDSRSKFWETEAILKSSCIHCGLKRLKESPKQKKQYEDLRNSLIFPARYIPDEDVFTSHVYRGWIVKPHVYELIKDLDLSNCTIRELTIIDE